MFCVKCGKKLEADAAFCTECGAKVEAPLGTAACSETGAPEIKAEKPAAYPALNEMPIYVEPKQNLQKKSIARCAWFAPAAVAISAMLYTVVYMPLYESLLSKSAGLPIENYGSSVAGYFLLLDVLPELLYILCSALCLGMYFAATAKYNGALRKQAALTVFIPIAFFMLLNAFFSNSLMILVNMGCSYSAAAVIVRFVVPAVRMIIAGGASYGVSYFALKQLEQRA